MPTDPRKYIEQAMNSMGLMMQLNSTQDSPTNVMADHNLSRQPLNNPGAMGEFDSSDPLKNAGRPSSGHGASPLNGVFRSGLQQLIADFGGKVRVSSGTRSDAEQTALWNQALKKYGSAEVARKWVAPPGHSNHNRGLAADLSFADDSTLRAVHARAKKYGLYFPMANESWHIEPLGSR